MVAIYKLVTVTKKKPDEYCADIEKICIIYFCYVL